MSVMLQITKSGYKQILVEPREGTVYGKAIRQRVRYQRPDGRWCKAKSFRLSARAEPGGSGALRRIERADDWEEMKRPALVPTEPGEADIFDLKHVSKWKKDKGTGHVGLAGIKVGSP